MNVLEKMRVDDGAEAAEVRIEVAELCLRLNKTIHARFGTVPTDFHAQQATLSVSELRALVRTAATASTQETLLAAMHRHPCN